MEVVTNLDHSSSRVKTVPITIQKQRNESIEELTAQRKRYLAMLRANEEKFSADPRFPFQIGVELHFLRDYKSAVPYLKKAIEQFLSQYSIDDLFNKELASSRIKTLQKHLAAMPNGIRGMIQLALYLLTQSLFFTGNMIQSKLVLANSRNLFPQNCQLIHFEAGICRHMGRIEEAKHLFQEMVAIAARATPEEIVILPSHARVIGLYNLAELEQSESLWKEALAENPASIPALLGLGNYYIKNGKREEALAIVTLLEKVADSDKAAEQLKKALS
jgi:tetratricopeptide (TPR) repeat protein